MIEAAYTREIKTNVIGLDVVAYKRALSRAGFMQWQSPAHPFTRTCGDFMTKAITEFQARHAIPVDGVLGERTHTELEQAHRKGKPKEWAFDAVAVAILDAWHQEHALSPEKKIRQAIVDAWAYWESIEGRIWYAQQRPMQLVKPPNYDSTEDCSEHFTLGHYAGGAPDPNGLGYNGQGYTGTLLGHGERCAYSDLQPGDAIMYGYTESASPAFPVGSPTHVAGYMGSGLVSSMGSNSGPQRRPALYRSVNAYVHYEVVHP